MAGALDRIDLLAVANSLPWLPAEPIGSFRRAHYPTAHLLEPHLTLVFPVPGAIGGDAFREHVRGVVSRTPAFGIRLRGLDKTWDHWLFLAVAEGLDEVIALHDALYTCGSSCTPCRPVRSVSGVSLTWTRAGARAARMAGN